MSGAWNEVRAAQHEFARRGALAQGTVSARMSAINRVVSALGARAGDPRTIDPEAAWRQFEETRPALGGATLSAYRSNFVSAVRDYQKLLVDPGWTPTRYERRVQSGPIALVAESRLSVGRVSTQREHELDLAGGRVATIRVPAPLTNADVERIVRFLRSISVPGQETDR